MNKSSFSHNSKMYQDIFEECKAHERQLLELDDAAYNGDIPVFSCKKCKKVERKTKHNAHCKNCLYTWCTDCIRLDDVDTDDEYECDPCLSDLNAPVLNEQQAQARSKKLRKLALEFMKLAQYNDPPIYQCPLRKCRAPIVPVGQTDTIETCPNCQRIWCKECFIPRRSHLNEPMCGRCSGDDERVD